jgi:hypothetical protein
MLESSYQEETHETQDTGPIRVQVGFLDPPPWDPIALRGRPDRSALSIVHVERDDLPDAPMMATYTPSSEGYRTLTVTSSRH